jgi:hypothetical protein
VYVPQLQDAGGLVGYVHRQLGLPVASIAPLAKITDLSSAAVHRFADRERIPWVDFAKGSARTTFNCLPGRNEKPRRGEDQGYGRPS